MIKYFLTSPILYGGFCWLGGLVFGIVLGRTAKTRPYEIERDEARAELASVLETIELKTLR